MQHTDGAADAANQTPPRLGVDEFSANAALVDGVRRFGASWASGELAAVGRLVGSEQFAENARLANACPPVLHALDQPGNGVGLVARRRKRLVKLVGGAGKRNDPGFVDGTAYLG